MLDSIRASRVEEDKQVADEFRKLNERRFQDEMHKPVRSQNYRKAEEAFANLTFRDTISIKVRDPKTGTERRLTVRVDQDFEIHKKLESAVLTIKQTHLTKSADLLALLRVGSKTLENGGLTTTSLPAYLFGMGYWGARRKNTADLLDLRKEAFIPNESTLAKYRSPNN
jgi:hypothetical protein